MLDIRLIREQTETVRTRLRQRGGEVWTLVDEVMSLDEARRKGETEKQALQNERNRVSKEIGFAKKQGQDTSAVEAEMRGIGDRVDALNKETADLDARQDALLLSIPNLPHEACPVGATADENPEVRVWGTKPVLAFAPKDHVALGTELKMLDFEAGVKISGSAFVVFRGAGARLGRAQQALHFR